MVPPPPDGGFKSWSATDVNARAAILHKVAALIRERTDIIATYLTMEQGKPIAEAKGEVASCAGVFDYFAEEAKRAYGRVLVRPTGQRSMVLKQPIGPVAAFKTVMVVKRLPKTRSGKILRATMRAIADGESWKMPATIDDPAVLDEIAATLGERGMVHRG